MNTRLKGGGREGSGDWSLAEQKPPGLGKIGALMEEVGLCVTDGL